MLVVGICRSPDFSMLLQMGKVSLGLHKFLHALLCESSLSKQLRMLGSNTCKKARRPHQRPQLRDSKSDQRDGQKRLPLRVHGIVLIGAWTLLRQPWVVMKQHFIDQRVVFQGK